MSSSINHHHQPHHDGGGGAWIHPCSLDYYHRLQQYYSTLPPAATTATTTIPSSDHLIRHQQQHYPSTSSPPLTYYFGDRLRIPSPLMFKFWIDKWSHRFTGLLEHDDDSFLVPWRLGDNAGGGGEGEGKVVVFDGASLFSYDITDKEAFAKSFSRTSVRQEPSHDTRDGCNESKSKDDVKDSKVQRDECKKTCTPQIETEEVMRSNELHSDTITAKIHHMVSQDETSTTSMS